MSAISSTAVIAGCVSDPPNGPSPLMILLHTRSAFPHSVHVRSSWSVRSKFAASFLLNARSLMTTLHLYEYNCTQLQQVAASVVYAGRHMCRSFGLPPRRLECIVLASIVSHLLATEPGVCVVMRRGCEILSVASTKYHVPDHCQSNAAWRCERPMGAPAVPHKELPDQVAHIFPFSVPPLSLAPLHRRWALL